MRSLHSKAAKSREDSVLHLARLSSHPQWASRWIQINNKASFQAHHKVHQALVLKLLSQAKIRRQPYGKHGHVLVKRIC